MAAGVIKRGPFVFTKRVTSSGDEAWDITLKCGTPMPTFFCVKNYGGEPGPGFAGWKLVSVWPFDQAGAYKTRDAAIAGVIPFVTQHTMEAARRKMAEATALAKSLKRDLKALES